MSSLISSNSGYHVLKFAERNTDAYKLTVKVNSLMPSLKAFAKREEVLLAIRHYICTKKMG